MVRGMGAVGHVELNIGLPLAEFRACDVVQKGVVAGATPKGCGAYRVKRSHPEPPGAPQR